MCSTYMLEAMYWARVVAILAILLVVTMLLVKSSNVKLNII